MEPILATILVGSSLLSGYFARNMLFKESVATRVERWLTSPLFSARGFSQNVGRYRKNELIFACLEKTCQASSQIDYLVRHRSSRLFLDNHPLRKLLLNPNRFMSEYDLLSSVILSQMLSGRAVLEKERNRAGQVIALNPLRPDWLEIVPSTTEIIAGFNYGPSGEQKVFIPYSDTVDFPLHDPTMPMLPFFPLSPVSVAARITDTDDTITDYVKLVFDKGGVPAGLLKTKQKLVEAQIKVMRRRWRERYGGTRNWLTPAILDSDAEYQRMGMTFEEMGFSYLDNRNESRICMVLDIPPIIVGAFVGIQLSSYDNYLTARKAWWQDSLLPKFESIRDRLYVELAPEYPDGDNISLYLDTSGVHALQDDINELWNRAANAFRTGAFTVNMYLEEIGKNPIGQQGDVFLRPLANETVPYDTNTAGFKEITPLLLAVKEDDSRIRLRKRKERALARAIKGLLQHSNLALIGYLKEYGTNSDLATLWESEAAYWSDDLAPLIQSLADSGFDDGLDMLLTLVDIDFDDNIFNEAARDFALNYRYNFVKNITDSTAKQVGDKIAAWIESDTPLDDLILSLEPLFGESRAFAIATTEVTRIYAEANLESWKLSDIVESAIIETVVDDLVCPICSPLHGTEISLDSEEKPPYHAGCRCMVKPKVKANV